MFDARDGEPAVAEMAGITGGSFVLNGVTWHHENDFEKLRRELSEWAQKVSYALGGRPGEFNLTPDQADRQIRELTTERDTWMRDALAHCGSMLSMQDELAEAKAELEAVQAELRELGDAEYEIGFPVGQTLAQAIRQLKAKASPSLPDVKSSEALRFAADVNAAHGYILDAHDLRVIANRLEREQAAKTAQDHAIEQAAQVAYLANNTHQSDVDWDAVHESTREGYRRTCRALFEAGLLKAGE